MLGDPETSLAASAVSGQAPRLGPQWLIRLRPLEPRALAYDKPLCASKDGFTLHAATRAGALDAPGREALLRYVLRPPIAQDKLEQRPDGLVRLLFATQACWRQPASGERASCHPRSPKPPGPFADAAARGGDPRKMDKVRDELAKGDAAIVKGDLDNALEHFKKAWKAAQEA